MKILTINPGSTSTKISIFEDTNLLFEEVLRHPAEELSEYPTLKDQYEYRENMITDFIKSKGFSMKDIDAIGARGGLIGPIEGGTYKIDEKLAERLGTNIVHASNLAGLIAYDLTKHYNIPSFITNPVTVDEMSDIAKITGVPGVMRKSKFHALNQKAVAGKVATKLGKNYDECNLIVVHLGGGVSIGAHSKGKVIDVNNCIDGDGPMSPNRAGSLPVESVIELCFNGKYTESSLKTYVSSEAGLWAYLGTSDTRDVQKMIAEGNKEAEKLYQAFAYQVAKSIGAMATVLKGDIDAIVITGGIAYSDQFVGMIKERISFIGKIIVMPGEEEMLALAEGALRVMNGEEKAKIYKG